MPRGTARARISDELNLSMETVTYLLMKEKEGAVPKDVLIDWTSVSGRADLLDDLAALMIGRSRSPGGMPEEPQPDASAVVGIALSGVPLATLIALQENLKLAVYFPSRHSAADPPVGSLSGNFAPVNGEACVIVDDVITSGKTLREAVEYPEGPWSEPRLHLGHLRQAGCAGDRRGPGPGTLPGLEARLISPNLLYRSLNP